MDKTNGPEPQPLLKRSASAPRVVYRTTSQRSSSSTTLQKSPSSSGTTLKRVASSPIGTICVPNQDGGNRGGQSQVLASRASQVINLLKKVSSTVKGSSGKRQRKATKPFQFDEASPSPKKKKRKHADEVEDKVLHYNRGEYLALRNEEDDFWLCRVLQRVYETTEKVKIQWLYEVKTGDPERLYGVDYHAVEFVDSATILTSVKLQKVATHTYKLLPKQLEKVRKDLKRALMAEEGILDEEDEEEDEDEEMEENDDDEEESEEDEEPPLKKACKAVPTKAKAKTKAKPKKVVSKKKKVPTATLR